MVVAVGLAWIFSVGGSCPSHGAECRRCGWAPPKTTATLTVRRTAELVEALGRVRPGTTILLEDGVYRLRRMLDISVPDVVLRGKRGDRSQVVLCGNGMDERKVGVALSVNAPRVVVADLTVGSVGFHGIQVRGEQGASNVVLHNILVIDTGQQLVKGSTAENGKTADHGLIACSAFEYSDHAPSDYTNGVDILKGKGWVIRDNFFLRIRGPREKGWGAGPAILFWVGSQDTAVERNLVLDCYRGIALGLVSRSSGPQKDEKNPFDHRGGVIRNNVVCNLNPWADEGIEANDSPGVRVEHNTVLVEGKLPWSISIRFSATTALVRNNLSNRQILLREGARAELKGNVTDARSDWFVEPRRGILRLARGDLGAIDIGVPIPEVQTDFDRSPRTSGAGPDAGAFEYVGTRTQR